MLILRNDEFSMPMVMNDEEYGRLVDNVLYSRKEDSRILVYGDTNKVVHVVPGMCTVYEPDKTSVFTWSTSTIRRTKNTLIVSDSVIAVLNENKNRLFYGSYQNSF